MQEETRTRPRVLTDLADDDVREQVVLVRVDFNVRDDDGGIVSETRIAKSVRTILWLVKHEARVVLLSHCGRPCRLISDRLEAIRETAEVTREREKAVRKKVLRDFSLDVVALRLGSLLTTNRVEVDFVEASGGPDSLHDWGSF